MHNLLIHYALLGCMNKKPHFRTLFAEEIIYA